MPFSRVVSGQKNIWEQPVPNIITLIEEFVLSSLLHKRVFLPRISKAELIMLGLAILLGVTGYIFAAVALYGYLGESFPPGEAALISCAVAFATAIILTLIWHALQSRRKLDLERARNEIKADFGLLLKNIQDTLDEPIRENPKISVALAALSGFFAVDQHHHHNHG